MFYEKCFRFWLLKKSNASEFASDSSFRSHTLWFKVKNKCKSTEEAKAEHLLFVTSVIFRSK